MANLGFCGFDFLDVNGLPLYFLQNTGQDGVDLTGTLSRTGIGCLVINSGAFGPVFSMAASGSPGEFYWGCAINPNLLADNSGVVNFGLTTLPPPNIIDVNTTIFFMGDGSIKVTQGNGHTLLGRSAPGVVSINAYPYVEAHVVESATVGSMVIRVNGVTTPVLTITGVNTMPRGTPSTGLQFLGAGGGGAYCYDDFYCHDTTGTTDNTFWGPYRCYTGAPIADKTPLQMTPSTPGPHYILVSTIPQQIATYVQDGTPGQVDQYQHSNSNVPSDATIYAVRHELYMGLDAAGAGSAGSSVNGAAAPTSLALSTSPKYLSTLYEVNPVSLVSWQKADFATVFFGPIVVS